MWRSRSLAMKSKNASSESVLQRTFPQTTSRSFRYFLVIVIGRVWIFVAIVRLDISASPFFDFELDSFPPFAVGLTLVNGLPSIVPLPFADVFPLGEAKSSPFDMSPDSRSDTISLEETDFFDFILHLNSLDKTGNPQHRGEQDLECGAIFAAKSLISDWWCSTTLA